MILNENSILFCRVINDLFINLQEFARGVSGHKPVLAWGRTGQLY